MALREEERSLSRKKGAILAYVYSFSQIAVNLLYVPLLLTGIGQSEYGLFQMIGSIMAYICMMEVMISGGVTRFYCKFFFEANDHGMDSTLASARSIFIKFGCVAFVAVAIAAVVVSVLYSHVLTEFQVVEATVMLLILAANLNITMHNSLNVAVINAHERFVFLKTIQILSVVLQPVVVLILLNFFPFAVTVCVVQLMANLACAIAQWVFARKILGAKVRLCEGYEGLKRDLIAFSGGILLMLIADQLFWKTNQLVLGYMGGMGVVAVYSVAMQIAQTAYQPLGTAISSVFVPKVSQLYFEKKDIGAISELFINVGRLASYPLLLVLLGFILFGREFVFLWAGSEYEEAYYIALLVMIPFTVDLLQNISISIMQVMNCYADRGKIYLLMAVLNFVLVIIVVPKFGALGAAAVTGFTMFLGSGVALNVYFARKLKLDVIRFWREIAPILLKQGGVAILFAVAWVSVPILLDGWTALLLGIALFTVVYVSFSWLFVMNHYEKKLVLGLLLKLKKAK